MLATGGKDYWINKPHQHDTETFRAGDVTVYQCWKCGIYGIFWIDTKGNVARYKTQDESDPKWKNPNASIIKYIEAFGLYGGRYNLGTDERNLIKSVTNEK